MLTRSVAAMLLVVALHVPARAQDLTGTIDGVMRAADGAPPAGLQVQAVGAGVVVTVDPAADGAFMFTDLPLGNYRVQAVDSTGRVLARGTARLSAAMPAQSVTLRLRREVTQFGGTFVEPASTYFGAVGVTPTLALLNGGVDSNVFNETDARDDAAFMVQPEVALSLDAGAVRGQGDTRVRYLYFDKYSTERSLNTNADGRLEVTINRFTPWASGLIDGGRRRINHEIDLRADQLTLGGQIGMDIRVAERTVASLAVGRTDHGFGPSEIFLGANLQELLNRKEIATTIEVRQQLVAGVTALGQVNLAPQRFRFTPQRDVDIVRLQGGLMTNTGDRATGAFRLGYISLSAVGTGVADYRGFVASVNEDLRLGSRTRLRLTGIRDIDFSYDALFPDYVRTGAVAELRAQLSGIWEADVRVEGERMAHQPAPFLVATSYAENYGFLGGGIGVRIARGLRLGVEGGREERSSPLAGRGFAGYRAGGWVTIGARPLGVCGCGFE